MGKVVCAQTGPSLRFSTLNSDGIFLSKRRPQMSIVAPWPPKMTPKWSPKWSQGKNGRSLRNMHRHRRIACPPPLGEPHFRSLFQDAKYLTTNNTHNATIQQKCPKRLSKGAPFSGPKSEKNGTFRTLAPLGVQMGARTAKITKMTSRMLPGSLIFYQQRATNAAKRR